MRNQRLAEWLASSPLLVAEIGRPGLPAKLDESLRRVAGVDLTCAFAYPDRGEPTLLHDGLGGVSSPGIMANYLSGTYLLDAVYAACARGAEPGLHRLRDLAPDAFFEGEYYNSPHVHPCISMESGSLAEEIVYLVPLPAGGHCAYSLMRANGSDAFSDEEFEDLRGTEPMVRALLAQHWRDVASGAPAGRASWSDRGAEALELAFESFAPEILTAREQMVVSLILRGHSSLSIGQRLGIAEGTVKNHRKHIHAKLRISSQAELFNLFVGHVLGRRPYDLPAPAATRETLTPRPA